MNMQFENKITLLANFQNFPGNTSDIKHNGCIVPKQ